MRIDVDTSEILVPSAPYGEMRAWVRRAWALSLWLCWLWPALAMAATPPARFALVIGHNQGDQQVKALRYAQRDASQFARVLRELGGFPAHQIKQLIAPTRQQVRAAFRAVRRQMKSTHRQGIFILYYSGHSRDAHFLLGKETLAYKEVTKFVQTLPVHVRLLIVDSCYSGQIAAAKGAARKDFIRWSQQDFRRNTTQQFTMRTKGYAVLASSGAGERSYESERLRSSFFTASLILGLRGAADRNQDQRISLNEAYHYARNQTMQFSGQHKTKLQRPVFFWKIKGDGPLILTLLQRAEAKLAFSAQLKGYCLLYKKGELVHEFNKESQQRVVVGIPQGTYQIQLRRDRWIGVHNVTLRTGRPTIIRAQDLRWYKQNDDSAKGHWQQPDSHLRVGFLAHYVPVGQLTRHGVGLSLHFDLTRWMRLGLRYQLSLLNPDNFTYSTHGIGLQLGLGYSWDVHYFRLWLGAQLEPRLSIRTNHQTKDTFANMGTLFSAAAHIDWTITWRWSLRLAFAGGGQLIFYEQATKLSPVVDVAIGLFWNFL